MTEQIAETLANIMGGEAWQSGGGIWVVTINRQEDGKIVVVSDEVICEYDSEEALEECRPSATIMLTEERTYWVFNDQEGNVFYRDPHLEVGWPCEEDAEHEARLLESQTGEPYMVRRQ